MCNNSNVVIYTYRLVLKVRLDQLDLVVRSILQHPLVQELPVVHSDLVILLDPLDLSLQLDLSGTV